jgi:hypothetical protein
MASVRGDQVAHCDPMVTIPTNTRASEPYWHRKGEEGRYTFDADAPFGLPMRPTPFYVQVTLVLPGGEEVIQGLPVQQRYEGNIFSGEKRTEMLVVPALSVRVTPEVSIVPSASIRARPPSNADADVGAETNQAPRRTGRCPEARDDARDDGRDGVRTGGEAAGLPTVRRRSQIRHDREHNQWRRAGVGEARPAAGMDGRAARPDGQARTSGRNATVRHRASGEQHGAR